ncbi:MAG TPA: hypothetical protein VGO96_17580 [Pyrinomonadaceae bacterium]|nr:hypothetical protein [Pyrinomonadaceae bacterium]
MKFPRSVRSCGASLAVSLLLSPVASAQRPAKPPATAPTTRTTTAAAASAANERTPAATFDTLLSADAYGVYAEVRMVGRQAASQEIAQLIAPLTLGGGAPPELLNLYEFIKANAEPLTEARLMFATMPVRAGLPEVLVAVEMPSVEEARKFLPELKQFIAVNVAPQPSGATTATLRGASPEEGANAGNRRGRRRARANTTEASARVDASKPPAAPPFQVKRSGQIIAMSNDAFTFKNLRGARDQALLVDEPGFQSARTRFGTDTIFVYFNTVRMFGSTKAKQEAYEKEYRRQEELAQAEARKRGDAANADTVSVGRDIADDQIVNTNGNSNSAVVSNSNTRVRTGTNANIASPEDEAPPPPPATPEATPSPKSEKELQEERQREQSRQFAQTLGSLVFGEGPMGSVSAWPESIGVGASLEADSVVVRGLFVNLADDQPLRPIPFLPVVLSGPSIAAEAPAVLPSDTDIFLTVSLDLPQMYDYLASMMKIIDLTAKSDEGKGGFEEQLTTFEKTNNFRIKEELLAALGNEIAIGLPATMLGVRSGKRAGDGAGISSFTSPIAVIALNDKKALQELLPRVLRAVGFAGATEESIIEKHGGVEVLTFSNGTLAFIDRFLVSTTDAETMRRITEAYNNGETLANNERFRDSTSWQAKQAVGQIYVSNEMLKGMFEDVAKAVTDIEDESIRAYLLRLDPDPGSITLSATRESNGLMHELHLPKNLLSLLTASDLINRELSTLRGNEAQAKWKLRMLHSAEEEHKESTGHYGTLEELKAAGRLNEEHETMELENYEIRLSVSGDKFEATATPKAYPKLGRRSYYIDHTGSLRGSDTGGKPASVSDPPVDF